MRRNLLLSILFLGLMLAPVSLSLAARQSAPPANDALTGRWVITADFYGTPLYFSLKLAQLGDKLSGELNGDKLEGAITGNSVHFIAKGEDGGTAECMATLQNGSLSGTLVFTDPGDKDHPEKRQFTATLVPQRRVGAPRIFDFVPKTFYRQFSAANTPVLTISPGDNVYTTTVDAGGTDEKGVTRVLGGNPETGPFYIETAVPGDTLVVHLTRVRLNRDWAISDDAIVDRGLDSDLAVQMKDGGKSVRWHLDTARGVATLEKPGAHTTKYTVPLKPMLGCIATAPGPGQAPPGTGDSGRYGGNMDFNEVIEGATVYLPVNVPGALLYLGDGHAAQGDGELNGNALETSMSVWFSVDVVPGKRIRGPRVESATQIMAVGLGGSIDEAFRSAIANMSQWLTSEYKLTPAEVAEVLGTSSEIKVSEVADRNAGIVVKINKDSLQTLLPPR